MAMSTIVKLGSGTHNEAIEVALLPDGVALLDSKLHGNGALWFTPGTWLKFVEDVKRGKYDTHTPVTA